MRRHLIVAVSGAGLACASLFSVGASGHGQAAVCSKAAATKAVNGLPVRVQGQTVKVFTYVYDVLCGPFAGPGSRAMAVTGGQPPGGNNCLGVLNGWFVLRDTGGVWKPVPGGIHYPTPITKPVQRTGTDLLETETVHPANAPHCDITGFRQRTWHWTGSQLVPSAFVDLMPSGAQNNVNWFSPDKRVWCTGGRLGTSVRPMSCFSKGLTHGAAVTRTGSVTVCTDPPGPDLCAQNWGGTDTPVQQPSQPLNVNGFHCTAETDAITCVVASGAGRGKGFRLTGTGQVTKLP